MPAVRRPANTVWTMTSRWTDDETGEPVAGTDLDRDAASQ